MRIKKAVHQRASHIKAIDSMRQSDVECELSIRRSPWRPCVYAKKDLWMTLASSFFKCIATFFKN